jgi:hypothetical protein
VFQRLFWRRPSPGDRILQAATRTLSGAPAQASVRWYLLVEPSPELVRYLREENAFGLSAGRAGPVLEQAPEWFAFDASEVDVLRGVPGGMVLAFNRSSGLLYATDTGAGFAASVEPPPPAPRPAQGTVSVGRLPPTPPPLP